MATVSGNGETGLGGEPAGNRKIILVFIAVGILFLIIFAFVGGSFWSSDGNAGEEPTSQPEAPRARP